MIGNKKFNDKKERFKFTRKIYKKIYYSKLGEFLRNSVDLVYKKIERSIRFEVIFIFFICFLTSFAFYTLINDKFDKVQTMSHINYDYGSIQQDASDIVRRLSKNTIKDINDKEVINDILKDEYTKKTKIYLTDLDGKVVYSVNGTEEKLDIYSVIDKSNSEPSEGGEKILIYPVKIGDDRCYLIYSKIPATYISEEKTIEKNSFVALILSTLLFIFLFVIVTNRKMKYLEEIDNGVRNISSGNLSYRIKVKGKDEIRYLAENINTMAEEIERSIEKERRVEQAKSELITNVSHDLRTPLTSVMGYIGLIKHGRYEDESTMQEYLDIAFSKANQLKDLIQDLFEYSKLSSAGVVLEKSKVNVVEFLSQIIEEYIPVFEENNLTVKKKIIDENSMVYVDASKMARVFENLLSNAIKYSEKPSEIIITSYENNGYVNIIITNKGEPISQEKIDKIFDRFYRADEARNSNIKGSGLGLAITKNIVELHDGEVGANCIGNEISFFVRLKCIK